MIPGQTSLLQSTDDSFKWPDRLRGREREAKPLRVQPPGLQEPFLTAIWPPNCKVLVVVEHFEDEAGPMRGPAGEFFRSELAQHLPIERIGFVYSSAEELQPMVEAADWVLVSGNEPLSCFRRDLIVQECHGRPILLTGMLDGAIVVPVWHYVAFYRNLYWVPLLRKELALFTNFIASRAAGESWYPDTPDSCVKCRGEFWRCDRQGVVYCEQHWGSRRRRLGLE